MTTFEIVEVGTKDAHVGDLKITLTDEGKEYLADIVNQSKNGEIQHDEQIFLELCETNLCNGYHIVAPESIGALTSSLLIADGVIDEETKPDEKINVWYYNMYAIKSYIKDFQTQGYIIFNLAK